MSLFSLAIKSAHRAVGLRRRLRGPLRPSWSHEYETLATILHSYGLISAKLPVAALRKFSDDALKRVRPPRGVALERVDAGGVPSVWFRVEAQPERESQSQPEADTLMYLHGGGYCYCSVDSHKHWIAKLCRRTGFRGFAVDYRLAPEHPHPAALDDALAAYRWLLRQGVDPQKLVVGGESAGGGLTLALLVSLRDAGEPLPRAAFCISPWVDLEAGGESFKTNHRYDYINTAAAQVHARMYVPEGSLRQPLAAPLYADLRGLPPLIIQAGGAETLLDDARRISQRAEEAGVEVTLEVWDDMIHAWHLFVGQVSQGTEAIDKLAQHLKHALAPRPGQ